ncbi:MAG TPA: chorismate-binding protein, partial [Anaerolineales bacterium]|nr:chorismate-binding protein [Anaerolineales bacterium]
ITCRPMKGTTQRGRTAAEDHQRAEWLRRSPKNLAENVMIVDMVRNDLGRIAEIGTVRVPELFRTERYPTLWQMTSTVTARTSASIAEIFTALFPCASITGAPKVSTMQIIAELETTPRGIYTGSIGYISPERKAKFNVAIRTAAIDPESQTVEYGVGGGIVWDSTSRDEYDEALLKARVLMEPPPAFSLIETMLWTPEEGFFLGEKHLRRLLDSADYFDIPMRREILQSYLAAISSRYHSAHEPQRVRILLDQAGYLDFESRPFERVESDKPLAVCLSKQPVDSGNVFLYHKTTQRSVYERSREGCEGYEDILLYNERGELTEFTIGNLVAELEGQLVTPPVSCGLLPGIFRASLLETAQVMEQVIPVERLSDCTRIFRVNSVRRWQEVELRPELRKVS